MKNIEQRHCPEKMELFPVKMPCERHLQKIFNGFIVEHASQMQKVVELVNKPVDADAHFKQGIP